MSYPFSGSGYGRVRKCAPSAVLWRVRHETGRDAVGSAVHEHLCDRARHGVSYAMERIVAVCQAWRLSEKETGIVISRCRSFEWSPPRGALAEIALCLCREWRVVTVKGGRGVYEVPADGLVPLTIDVMWSEPEPLIWPPCSACNGGEVKFVEREGGVLEPCYSCDVCKNTGCAAPICPEGSTLFVADYKTGSETHVDPIESNAQLDLAALVAARWTGAQLVMPVVIFVGKGEGQWDVPAYSYDEQKLEELERELARVLGAVERERENLAQRLPLAVTEGGHCTYCEAQHLCPAKTAMVRSALDGELVGHDAKALTDEQRVKAAHALPLLDGVAKRLRALLRADVDARGDIPLGDGNVWGPYKKELRTIDPQIGVEALVEVLADDIEGAGGDPDEDAEEAGKRAEAEARKHAVGALKITLSGDDIEDAVAGAHEKHGLKKKKASSVRRVFGVMAEKGGLGKRVETWYGPHKPKPPAPELADQLAASLDVGSQ